VNASLVFITQNLFYKSSIQRNISLNLHYMVIMKNRRDKSQINHLARQLCPIEPNYVVSAYEDATRFSYSYLFIDFTPNAPDELHLRAFIFPLKQIRKPGDEQLYTVYLRKIINFQTLSLFKEIKNYALP